jgi:ATP-dependent Clp protease ATP-binding subunit ClpA
MWRTESNTAKAKIRMDGGEPHRRPSIVLDPSRTGRVADDLDGRLRRMIVGQDQAIEEIVNIYQMHLTGMNPPGRPVGNFLFLGPTGSGKTRIVEATAEALVGSPSAVIKIDCAEFQHSHEIAKLIGSPPGYLGHRETHPLLSQETLNQHHTDAVKISFVLFDEIEKSSDALWNLLLGILDKATLTLGDNRKVDFSRAMIFMTSNLGAKEMSHITAPKLGFGSAGGTATARPEGLDGKIERTAMEAAKKKFTPEFMNRLDKIVVFQSLGEAQLRRIVDLELSQVQKRIFQSSNERPFVFTATAAAKQYLLDQGTDIRYGARHLKRAIERLVVQPISNLMATDQIQGGDWIQVDCVDGRMTFLREAEGLTVHSMAQMVEETVAVPLIAATAATEQARAAARSSRRA